MLNQHKGPLKK